MNDTGGRQRVLIVDDEPINLAVLKEILQPRYEILSTDNGLEALKLARAERPDIVLLDVMMPGLDGHEVCVRLKDDPQTADIPVIFITSMTEEREETAGLALGAVDYIIKPVNAEIVRLRVKNQLELKRHRNHLEEIVRQRTRELALAKDAAEAGDRAKSEFLSIISHELRSPLNLILGYSSLISQGGVSGALRENIDTIHGASQTLLELIDEILSYVKMDAGGTEESRQPFSLRPLLAEMAADIAEPLRKKGLFFQERISEGVADAVLGSPQRLKHVLRHLLENAIKFTDVGSITLIVDRPEAGGGEDWVQFSVQDTGKGIPADKHETIFHHFTQLEPAHTRHQGGLGLGLTSCKRHVALMGGRIWLESRVGEGSTFHFSASLPAQV